jgi:2'-5' RNA ligase
MGSSSDQVLKKDDRTEEQGQTEMPEAARLVTREALAARYDALWEDAAPAVRAGDVTLDPWVMQKDADARRGLTLLARPDAEVLQRLDPFLDVLRSEEPEQYYQPAADVHLTVLSLFGATADPAPHLARLAEYRAAAAEALADAPAFAVEIEGVTLSRGAVMAQGFPRDGKLELVRERLRAGLAARGLADGVDQRYRLRTAHLTLVRFAAPLRRPERFVAMLADARRRAFGKMDVRRMELVVGDWYQSADRTRVVDAHPLTG